MQPRTLRSWCSVPRSLSCIDAIPRPTLSWVDRAVLSALSRHKYLQVAWRDRVLSTHRPVELQDVAGRDDIATLARYTDDPA